MFTNTEGESPRSPAEETLLLKDPDPLKPGSLLLPTGGLLEGGELWKGWSLVCASAGTWLHGDPASQEAHGSQLQRQQPLQSHLCVSWLSEVVLSSPLVSSRKTCNDVGYFGSSKQTPSFASQCSWSWEQFRRELMAECTHWRHAEL